MILYTSYNYVTLSTVDTNIIPLTLMRAILNIPNCFGGCPIALALMYLIAPVSSELSVHETSPVFVVQVKTTVSPGHTGE